MKTTTIKVIAKIVSFTFFTAIVLALIIDVINNGARI